jgi:hypothetical protein
MYGAELNEEVMKYHNDNVLSDLVCCFDIQTTMVCQNHYACNRLCICFILTVLTILDF